MTASSIRKPIRTRRSRAAGDVRLSRLTLLFKRKAAELDARSLTAVEAALSERHADARHLIEALIGSGDPARSRLDDLTVEGLGEVTSVDAGRAALDAITVDDDATNWAQSDLLGAVDAAGLLGVARSTLDNWRKEGRVLAFAKGVRNFVYPVEQFEGSKPVDGLREVRARFVSDESAWEWLVTPNRLTGDAVPLEWLRTGHQDEVARAAEGALDYA